MSVTDSRLVSEDAPSIPIGRASGTTVTGRIVYHKLHGFGKVFKGEVYTTASDREEQITAFFILKRTLPHTTTKTDIVQWETEVYFSVTLNTDVCRHLTLLCDVAQVRNSDGDYESLLILQWADGPCISLREWLDRHTETHVTIQYRLIFAV